MSQACPPISLSDEAMTEITVLLRPLVPAARSAFLVELANELRAEPVQPVGDGVVLRTARTLLRSGMYAKDGAYVIEDGAHYQEPKHYRPRRHA
jgi:hypothetical protein